jgi:hypothetical protein
LPETSRDALGVLAALALGLVGFFVLIGWPPLIPTNIAWLDFGDRAMHTLGWMFFRAAPWGNPPGLSPDLGIELANSIALVDGLPLFALPLKLISAWLPQPFQYWGYWLLVCFVLQALFAYAIAREMQAGRLVSLAAAAFALITPAFMFRVEMHLALAGHWTILAALYLYVRRMPPKLWMWPLLITLTAGIHAYLLALVAGLWAAALVERLWSRRMIWSAALAEIVASLVPALLVLWVAGFFTTGTTGTYGYGDYKLNLLWPLLTYRGWSQLFPDLPHTKYDYEGLSFLGIGIMALLVLALLTGAAAQLRAAVTRRWLPLVLMLVLMLLFAVTTHVHFADIELANIVLPKPLEDLVSTFRSTGRFVWPLLYIVTIGAVVMLGRRLRALIAVPVIVAAFAAQAVDSSPALLNFARHLPPAADSWETPLLSPFWDRAAAAGYTRIRVIPVISNPGTDWKALGYYAVAHHMAIDSVYLGRVDAAALAALRAREKSVLETGDFEPHTLYILDAPSAAAAVLHAAPGDLLATIDDRIVFARNGAALVDGLDVAQYLSGGT